MKSDQILYIGEDIVGTNGTVLLIKNNIYTIEEPWDFSDQNIMVNYIKSSKWVFFIYDETKETNPRGYELYISMVQHPRYKIINDIINS